MSKIFSQKTPSEVRGKSISYRPEIDGIRGLSIIMIVFHHFDYLQMHYFGGRGFLGVDIFFVLSGFLITQILLSYQEKNIGLRTFYLRRVARLYPILLVSTLLISYLVREDFRGPSLLEKVASIFYFKNFLPWGGIFGPLWSLSAEEQFYLIFPIVFILGMRYLQKKGLTYLLSAFAIVVWILALITSAPDFNFNASGPFNLVVFRPTMILIGCLIALNRESLEKRVSQSVTSALLIFVALVAATILWQFPPLAGIATGLLILLISDTAAHKSRTAKFLKRALSLKPLAWIGVLSYSIYIWHLPMIYWNSNHFMNQWLDTSIPVFFLMLIAVSAGSFYLFEKPLLKFLTKRSKV